MTILLISYKKALNDGVELQYMLRSLETNLHMPRLQTYLVGDEPPTWMKPDGVAVGNPTDSKVENMAYNIWKAARDLRNEDDVYYFSDDYFLLDPTDSIMPTYQ